MADPERDLDAAERALGTLPLEGEGPEDRALRHAWEDRLAPLLDGMPETTPPPGLFGRIERTIDLDETVVELASVRRGARRWKALAMTAAAMAAALAIWVAIPQFMPAPRYVAIVNSDADGTPGMVIEFDTGSGIATVIPVGVTAPEGRSLEMWHLPVGADKPRSLGLLPDGARLDRRITAGEGDIFAISFEPPGGSPTGQPTDPRYHGTIIQVD